MSASLPSSLVGGAAGGLDRVELLVAIEEIKCLKARYLQAVDDKDYGAIASVFTSDAVIDFTGEARHHAGHHGVPAGNEPAIDLSAAPVVGGLEAARVIKAAVHSVVTVHHCHDPQIQVTGSAAAHGRWSLYDWMEYDAEVMHGYGRYLETYERGSDGWRIASLRLERLRVVWEPVVTPS